MRKVVDSNFLQSDALTAYLSESPDNYAVLTDFAAMEAYKGDTLKSIYRSMEILAQHPRQVIVLKGTQVICGLRGREAARQKPLIDETQTREFSEYCAALFAAQRGDLALQQQLLEHGREATAHIDGMLQDMPTLSSGFDLVGKKYAAADVRFLRQRESPEPQMQEKIIQDVLSIAAEFFKDHPSVTMLPKGREIRDTFNFRYALCGFVLMLKGIEGGGPVKTNPKKLRNDVVDVNFATFATYFDGLLTADKNAGGIYADAEFLLREVFAKPPAWLGWLLQRSWFSRSFAFFGKI